MACAHSGGGNTFATVLELLYEAPFAHDAWSPALTAIADFVRAESCDLNFFEPKFFTYKRWEHARIDVDTTQRYAAAFMSDMRNVHPRVPVVTQMRSGQLFADSDLWSVAERNRMPYFADVFQRAGLRDGITSCVNDSSSGGDLIVLGAYFARQSRAVPLPESRKRIGMVLPHVRRACTVEAKLLQARKETAALTDALDRITETVAMLDRDGRVVYANRVAAAMFRTGSGTALASDERLLLSTGEARQGLAQALSRCASALLWTPGHDIAPAAPVVVPRPTSQPLVLTLQPLPKDLAGAFGAVALVFISDPDRRQPDRCTVLRAVYGLTLGEAQLAQAICDGTALKQYAESHRITYETARTYMRRIFDKTGTRRQSDLVSVIKALR